MADAIIEFPYGDIMLAAQVGVMRRTSGIFKKRPGRYGAKSEGRHWWGIDIESAIGELAVSRYCNLSWSAEVGKTDAVDVGGLVQVRSIEVERHRLMLHPEDNDDQPFVLAWVQPPRVYLRGWLFAKEGKQQDYWEKQIDKYSGEERDAFFVPTSKLRPMPELLTWITSRGMPQSVASNAA